MMHAAVLSAVLTASGSERLPTATREHEPRIARTVVHTTLLFTTMRTVEIFLWPHPFAETDQLGERWGETFTTWPKFDPDRRAFEWDGDRWWINAVGHSLLGMELHFRARQCDFGWLGSFGYTAAASAVWEYAFEGNAVRASGLDLVWTPLAGLMLGEARYALFRAASRAEPGAWRSIARFAIDPLGGVDHAITSNACNF